MTQLSSHAVETGSGSEALPATLEPAARANRLWPRVASQGWRHALLRRMLALADVAAATAASASLVLVSDGSASQVVWSLAFVPVWIVVAKLLGLYDRDQRSLRHLTVDEVPQIVLWALVCTSLLSLLLTVVPADRLGAASALVVGVVAGAGSGILRGSARWLWRATTPDERVAIVGDPESAGTVKRKLELLSDPHVSIVEELGNLDEAGDPAGWVRTIERLVYAPAVLDEDELCRVIDVAWSNNLLLSVVPPFRRALGSNVFLDHLAELPVFEYSTTGPPRSTLFLKRSLDVLASSIGLILLLPVFVGIALAIKLDNRGPVLFSQLRAGRGGEPFRMYKFRSMVWDAERRLGDVVCIETLEEPMFKLHDDPRVTRVGRALRRWSLDELPQLWNVLVGDMSLVGPRPEQLDLVDRYSFEQRFRLAVSPGITGPMQISGRGELTFGERLAVERDYIESLSIGRDLRILGLTLSAVVRGRGAY